MTYTYLEMYTNILRKFGRDSKELQKYKEYYSMYSNNKKIMIKIYKIIIEKA